jgi:hypothetical protein
MSTYQAVAREEGGRDGETNRKLHLPPKPRTMSVDNISQTSSVQDDFFGDERKDKTLLTKGLPCLLYSILTSLLFVDVRDAQICDAPIRCCTLGYRACVVFHCPGGEKVSPELGKEEGVECAFIRCTCGCGCEGERRGNTRGENSRARGARGERGGERGGILVQLLLEYGSLLTAQSCAGGCAGCPSVNGAWVVKRGTSEPSALCSV